MNYVTPPEGATHELYGLFYKVIGERAFYWAVKTGWQRSNFLPEVILTKGRLLHVNKTEEASDRKTLDDLYDDYYKKKDVSPADKKQVGGSHYKEMRIQPWYALDDWMTKDQRIGYYLGSSIAYLGRFNSTGPGKGGLLDIKKAKHYLEKLIEVMESK